MGEPVTLWGMGTVRSLRVLWALEELGIPCEHHLVHPRSGQTMQPEFLRINPRHKVPVIQHEGRVITESAAILEYLAEAFPAPDEFFVPRNAAERAKLHEWSYFLMTEIDAHTLYVIRRHVYLRHLYGEAPTAVCAAEAYFHDQLDAIAPSVAESGYLMGERFGTADILFATCLDWAGEYKMAVPRPLYDYHLRCTARPAYRRALARAFPDPATLPDMTPVARNGKWDPATSLYSGTPA